MLRSAGGVAIAAVVLLRVAGCAGHGAARTEPPASWRYDVRVQQDLSSVRVRMCFDGPAPAKLVAIDGEPGEWTSAFDARGRELDVDDESIDLDGVGSSECVRWVTSFDRALRRTRSVRAAGGDLLTTHDTWLWRPAALPSHASATVRFSLPAGVQVVTPWPEAADGAYVLERSAFTLAGDVAFGRFDVERLEVAGGRLRLARLEGRLGVGDTELRRWVRSSAEAVSSLYGRFPADRTTVIVMPVGRGPEPIAFGRVRRGGGPSVTLLVRANADLDGLLRDWVAVHELAHLLVPLVERPDAWISEGIATYFQEILRARVGLQSPTEAWHRLDRGFSRRRGAGTGRTLADEADAMMHTGAHDRVYWDGAAFAMELDVRLRRLSGGRDSLGSALESLRGVSDRDGAPWRGETVLRMLDRATGYNLFGSLGARYAYGREPVDVDPVFGAIGLVRGPDGQLAPDGSATAARLRAGIASDRRHAIARRGDPPARR